jgi:hypothetical protein
MPGMAVLYGNFFWPLTTENDFCKYLFPPLVTSGAAISSAVGVAAREGGQLRFVSLSLPTLVPTLPSHNRNFARFPPASLQFPCQRAVTLMPLAPSGRSCECCRSRASNAAREGFILACVSIVNYAKEVFSL